MLAEPTCRERLLGLLWDLDWHHHRSIRDIAGTRYSARLLELKRLGWCIEDKPAAPGGRFSGGKLYRLMTHTAGPRKGKLVKVFLTEATAEAASLGRPLTRAEGKIFAVALESFRANKDKL